MNRHRRHWRFAWFVNWEELTAWFYDWEFKNENNNWALQIGIFISIKISQNNLFILFKGFEIFRFYFILFCGPPHLFNNFVGAATLTDKKFLKEKRKVLKVIVLIVDNCLAHINIQLKSITLIFYPLTLQVYCNHAIRESLKI